MYWFNIVSGACSIAGLIFSIWIFILTGKIQKNIEFSHAAENFNIQHDAIMDELRSSGLNSIRTDFPDPSLLHDFQYKLLEYKKNQELLLDNSEKSQIDELVQLINSPTLESDDWRNRFNYLLNEITTKPRIRRN